MTYVARRVGPSTAVAELGSMSTSLRERPPPRPLAPRLPREGRRRSLTRRLSERPRRPDSLDPEARKESGPDRNRERPGQGETGETRTGRDTGRPVQGETGRDQDRERRGETRGDQDRERRGETRTGRDGGRPGQGETRGDQDRERRGETRTGRDGRDQDRDQTCNRREERVRRTSVTLG